MHHAAARLSVRAMQLPPLARMNTHLGSMRAQRTASLGRMLRRRSDFGPGSRDVFLSSKN